MSRNNLYILVLSLCACGTSLDSQGDLWIDLSQAGASISVIAASAPLSQDGFVAGTKHALRLVDYRSDAQCLEDTYANTSAKTDNLTIRLCQRFYDTLGYLTERERDFFIAVIVKHEMIHSFGGKHVACDGSSIMCGIFNFGVINSLTTVAQQQLDVSLLTYSKNDWASICKTSAAKSPYCD